MKVKLHVEPMSCRVEIHRNGFGNRFAYRRIVQIVEQLPLTDRIQSYAYGKTVMYYKKEYDSNYVMEEIYSVVSLAEL